MQSKPSRIEIHKRSSSDFLPLHPPTTQEAYGHASTQETTS